MGKGTNKLATPVVITTGHELRSALAAVRSKGKSIGLVPTMGALHEGHLSLVDASRAECDVTVVTIFVNPTQFGPSEDLEKYPRRLDEDLDLLGRRGVDFVFAPNRDEMYRPDHETYVVPGEVAKDFEGAIRPVHFRGVATIVLKLFNLVGADVAFFGQKDYQQTLVVRQMVADLDVPIQIRVCPIVRESDQLAMSSRNAYLSAAEREQALSLSSSLRKAEEMFRSGQRDAEIIAAAVREIMEEAGAEVEYIALVKSGSVNPVSQVSGGTIVLIAARVGKTRLLDNWEIE